MTARAVAPRVVAGVAARSSPRGKVVPAAKTESVATAAAAPASGKESLAVSTTTTVGPAPETVAAAPDRAASGEPQSPPEPVAQTGKGVDGGSKAVEREAPTTAAAAEKNSPVPAPALLATRSFAEAWAEEDNAFMMSLSDDDKEWHPLAKSKSASETKSNTPAAPTHAVEQGAKNTNPGSPRQKKAVKTHARVAPGKKQKPVVRTGRVAATMRGVAKQRHEKKVEKRKVCLRSLFIF